MIRKFFATSNRLQIAAFAGVLAFGILFGSVSFSASTKAPLIPGTNTSAGPCDVIRGQIINEGSGTELALRTMTLEVYKIRGSAPLIANLRKLKNGNSVVATGILSKDRTGQAIATLDSIQTVGLQELLGLWRSSRLEVFEFQDFSRLNLYLTRSDDQADVSFLRTHELSYAITIENSADYSIFISDNLKKVMAGSLHVSGSGSSQGMVLTLFDPATGHVAEKISLSPLLLK